MNNEVRNYSVVYRIIHWAMALCMLLILATIFLRLTWLNKDNVANIIQNYSASTDQVLSHDQSLALARQIRKPMWQWHIYLGYTMTALFGLRLLMPFFGQMKFINPLNKKFTLKNKFQYWVYAVFYVCVATSLFTGLMIEFGPENIKDPMEEIHVLSIYYLVAFLILHFGGVLLAEFSNQKGIISRIVSGTDKKKND